MVACASPPISPAPKQVSAGAAARSVAAHTRVYLSDTLGLPPSGESLQDVGVDELQLCDVTAILALGGAANVWVAFSAEIGLADAIRRIETAGFDPAEAERPEYLHAALAEVANIVLGHCTADLGALAGLVSLSTPMVIEQRRHLMRPHDVEFARVSFETSQGTLLIACITPREHFDHRLNPLSPAKEPT